MLARANRIVEPSDFRLAMRRGARGITDGLVVHYLPSISPPAQCPARVGLVVPKKQIRLASRRNRVKRQLRAIFRERLRDLPAGSLTVVGVRASCLGETSTSLSAQIDTALAKAKRRAKGGESA